ncbi:MAG: phosphoglycerate dehydrogenase [Candidatus Accumulibacter phosphatis]|uniref:D-3-phosphoglycerate dehydrogenase n=2 Tax=Candidatus Accumulibacter TaxID=327159 RepID=A0A080LVY4_9PROT|nr:phosphoglycerate dehydrogenase [Candidatus Accumulibacter contiguus]KFB72877.1 MAG: D-3-phosphoglycerate dehydrogenase [Candidatus Accumulibacter phosphatis]MBL8409108.1 phosphoglycerate dehydrogenase [Accumulibacter sp.]NMQ06006.1 ACT domain-containing protein [Candidatus Accumulibacter contiguus]HRF11604.1 phosphoglycerate dehydrogenase [Candidatus Accumulibacter phosphatis]
MYKVRTYNKISIKGLDRFPRQSYEVGSDIAHPDAFLLRSQKLQGIDVPASLLAVARAGAGVNNVPVAEYGKQGIVVFNTPGANANAVKELVMAGMLLSARGIVDGMNYVQSLADIQDPAEMSPLVEKAKSRFAGHEIRGKTIGIVGLGAIGSMVADMALAMGMTVVGFDPVLSIDAAWRLSNEVSRMENLQSLLARSDYVSLHVPAVDATRHMLNDDTLAVIKEGAVLLNFARDAIVNPAAVLRSLDAGRLGKYVCDFPEPALLGHPRIIAMPHIGASTEESEENCAVMAANQLVDYLENGHIVNSVNFPKINMERSPGTSRITFSNDNVSGVLGHVLSILANHQVNVVDMMNKSRGELAFNIVDVEKKPGEEVIDAIKAVERVIRVRVI